MSITGSMYSGISGLRTHSQAMSVIGNNLANQSTYGFKGSNTHFQDLFYASISTGSGIGQVGQGSQVAAIMSDFGQGPNETTTAATDVSIGGKGFFVVKNPDTNESFYTRAGNFRFDKQGNLIDTHGYIVQGWEVEPGSSGGRVRTVGSAGNIKLANFQSPPQATKAVNMVMNLNSKDDDKSADPTDPFFSLLKNWNGQKEPPLASSRYAAQNTIKVYDENGTSHDLTVYFDPVKDSSVTSNAGGQQVWEFIVTVPPNADGRVLGGSKVSTTSAAGLVMAGTLTFDAAGNITGMSAFTLGSGAGGDLKGLNQWTPAKFSDNGLPVFTANFSKLNDASTTSAPNATNIELDFGLRNQDTTGTGWAGAASNASVIGTTVASLNNFSRPQVEGQASTAYDESGSTAITQTQDGYGAGFLQSISINNDGVITGHYSNGQVLDLYALTLANFNSMEGLNRIGGNLFSETRESGPATTGLAGVGGLGTVSSNSLEQSNVDTAEQMVKMITTQRGFQANSKIITTADAMLQEVIQLKR
ncbi:MAG: flagellar hook protein FlgE [Desulfovibrio sp.]|uniref:flagellar hook protein FlgE n=1 Tax=Desulfovibrio sp. 7SRBS1 TaxID=3378064 RepID=UPI003B3ED1EB